MRSLVRWAVMLKRRLFSGLRFRSAVPGVDSLMSSVEAWLRRGSVTVHGHRMELDTLDTLKLLWEPDYEPVERTWLLEQLQPGDFVLDVGAHIGYYTLQFARAVGPAGRVIAIEPHPDNIERLITNTELNCYNNVDVVQAAASNKAGSIELFESTVNTGDHRLYRSDDDDVHNQGMARTAIQVEALTIDDVVRDSIGPLRLVKMDIQGAETAALEGMQELLRGESPTLFLEFWPYGLSAAGSSPEGLFALLEKSGYAAFELEFGDLRPVTCDSLLGSLGDTPVDYTNVVFRKAASG